MTLVVAGTRRDAGVTVVELGLKLVWKKSLIAVLVVDSMEKVPTEN